jgi:HEAT repeat protein
VLRVVMRRDGERFDDDLAAPTAAVGTAVEIAGGRLMAGDEETRRETRVLAFAEMLEAGLRPLAMGLRGIDGVGEDALEPITAALRDRSPRVRRSLCEVLSAMGGDKSVDLLIMMLQDPNPEIRARAIQGLGSLKAIAASARIQPLLGDPIAGVRAAAASALAEIGVGIACPAVIDALAEECRRADAAEAARAAMIDAVARLSDSARPRLAEALTNLPRPIAARLAASLDKNGVIERWLADSVQEKNEALATILGIAARLGVTRPFMEALDSTEEWVRFRAAGALGHSHDPAASAAIAALLNDPDSLVRTKAVESLAVLGQPLALAPLARAAADPDGAVRMAAVSGLRRVLEQRPNWRSEILPGDFDMTAATAETERALLSASMDAQEGVRFEAAEALGLMGSPLASEALVALALGDRSEVVRDGAARALARCPAAHVRRSLAGALEDADEERRARAVTILGSVGGTDAGRVVVEALRDPSPRVRAAALGALSRSQVSVPIDSLIPETRNSDPRIRAAVTARLARERSPESVQALVQTLSDPDQNVRVNALAAMGAMGRLARKHEGALSARLTDPSPEVREAAAGALRTLREAWMAAPDTGELLRQGPLSAAAAANIVEIAIGGDTGTFLRALDSADSAQAIASFLVGAGKEKLNPLLSALRQSDERDQARVLPSLSQALRGVGSADGYLAELKALDSGVRLMAVELAGLLATPDAVSALLDVLERDPLAEVRSRAASMLAGMPGEAVHAALVRTQEEDPNEVVRLVAARVLGRARTALENAPPITLAEETPSLDSVQGRTL